MIGMKEKPKKVHPNSPWPKKLKALRVKLKISQVQAAARAGVAARTWIAWENSQTVPSRLALNLLRDTFPGEKF